MRIQLIYAHPVEGSFCSELRDMAQEALQRSGHQVRLTDLYAEGFPPALTKQERLNYEAAGANITDVRTHVERLGWAQGLILVFPTWWYGMPAILKGYFDRVWVPGVAFELDPRGSVLRPHSSHGGRDHVRLALVVHQAVHARSGEGGAHARPGSAPLPESQAHVSRSVRNGQIHTRKPPSVHCQGEALTWSTVIKRNGV